LRLAMGRSMLLPIGGGHGSTTIHTPWRVRQNTCARARAPRNDRRRNGRSWSSTRQCAARAISSGAADVFEIGPPVHARRAFLATQRNRRTTRRLLWQQRRNRETGSRVRSRTESCPGGFLCFRPPCAPERYRANSEYTPRWPRVQPFSALSGPALASNFQRIEEGAHQRGIEGDTLNARQIILSTIAAAAIEEGVEGFGHSRARELLSPAKRG
jgi:hypothetical protein